MTAAVDVSLLLETLKCTDTQVGEWVNVMGYVQAAEEEKGRKRQGVRHEGEKEKSQQEVRKLQAVMLWSAGGVRVWEYEKALEMRKGMEASAK